MMKKILFSFMMMLSLCGVASAQPQSAVGGDDAEDKGTLTIGGKMGFTIPTMRYSSSMYSPYDNGANVGAVGGLYADYRFYKGLSVRPEFLFCGRGGTMEYYPRRINYEFRATYFDMRFPFIWTFNHKESVRPYLGVGPCLNFVRSGKISYREVGDTAAYVLSNQTKGSIKGFDFSLYFGGGCSFALPLGDDYKWMLGLEVGYTLGLMDNFADAEKNTKATAINTYLYEVQGSRKNGCVEVAMTFGFPIDFGKPKKEKPEPVVEQVAEDTNAIRLQKKTCYSLDEMLAFVTLGMDISDKKICAFDDLKFDFGKATIRSGSEDYLKNLLKMLKSFPKMRLTINGHTDNVGSEEHNMKLSLQRAQAVADYLIKHGVASDRLECHGYGFAYPLDTNETEEGRARNRRVEIDILNIE